MKKLLAGILAVVMIFSMLDMAAVKVKAEEYDEYGVSYPDRNGINGYVFVENAEAEKITIDATAEVALPNVEVEYVWSQKGTGYDYSELEGENGPILEIGNTPANSSKTYRCETLVYVDGEYVKSDERYFYVFVNNGKIENQDILAFPADGGNYYYEFTPDKDSSYNFLTKDGRNIWLNDVFCENGSRYSGNRVGLEAGKTYKIVCHGHGEGEGREIFCYEAIGFSEYDDGKQLYCMENTENVKLEITGVVGSSKMYYKWFVNGETITTDEPYYIIDKVTSNMTVDCTVTDIYNHGYKYFNITSVSRQIEFNKPTSIGDGVFAFTPETSGAYDFKLDTSHGYFDEGNLSDVFYRVYLRTADGEAVDKNKLVAGETYFIDMYFSQTIDSDNDTITVVPGVELDEVKAVDVSTLTIDAKGAKITWSKNPDASGYEIYKSTNDGSYTKLTTITSGATVSFTDTAATVEGTKYSYYVIAYKNVAGENYVSKKGASKSAVRLTSPAVSEVANASTGMTVKWTKNAKATGYELYRKEGSGSYVKVATITNNATVSYNDTKATKNGTRYQYYIKAYKTIGTAKYYAAAGTSKAYYRVLAVAVSAVSNTSTGIKISWAKSSTATGYEVYRKLDGGSYTKIATITSNATVTFTDNNAANGKKYTYKVNAYKTVSGTKYYNKSGATAIAVRLTRPTITASNNSTRQILVSWNKNSSATGYQIRYVTGTTTKTLTVTGATSLKKTITALTKGKTYELKVRSYKTVSGKKYYSAWSAKKSVKVVR